MERKRFNGNETVEVIFRVFEDGDVIALFPNEQADNEGNVMSYMKIGQHGAASKELILELRPATLEESEDLKNELTKIGYDWIEADRFEKPQLIKSMSANIQQVRGYGVDGFELNVTVSFDSKEFAKIRKSKQDPLSESMAQIKNVVFEACGVRGVPGYSAVSMNQRFPRASKGLVTLELHFDISFSDVERITGQKFKRAPYTFYHSIELQKTLDKTRNDGHLFAKTALASATGH